MRKKPRIPRRAIADHYSMKNEKIIEISHPESGAGCLVSIVAKDDGGLQISVYRSDKNVTVSLSTACRD